MQRYIRVYRLLLVASEVYIHRLKEEYIILYIHIVLSVFKRNLPVVHLPS